MAIPTVQLAPEVITYIMGVPVSNTVIASIATSLIIITFVFLIRSKLSLVPGKLQVAAEFLVDFFYTKLVDVYGATPRAKRQAGIIISFFLFVLIANQFSLIPLVQSVVVDGKAVFKTSTAHLSQTLSLAIAVIVISHFIAFTTAPIKHIGNYVKFGSVLAIRSPKDIGTAFLDIFLGILDIIGEFAKIVSLSCRLFGNIFAGEVMVAIIAGLSIYTQYIVPVPFMVLSIFSGVIQALVFALLALSFISGTVKSVESD